MISALNKFTCPMLFPTILHREPLVAALIDATSSSFSGEIGRGIHYKLVLLCAPAGYGKTTLLVDFSRSAKISCCWYLLDETDKNLYVFFERIVKSIRQIFPFFGLTLDLLLDHTLSTDEQAQIFEQKSEFMFDSLLFAIENEISERFAFIFCNYQEVNNHKGINKSLDRLLQFLPHQCIMVIESRVNPALELTSLLTHREMFGIGSNGLRFSAQDVYNLAQLQKVTQFTYQEAEQLFLSYDGWISGILLGTHLGDIQFVPSDRDAETLWTSPALRMNKQKLLSYIVNEVFKSEIDMYTFLRDTSILTQIDSNICNALLDISESSTRLAYIEQQGLFVTCNSNPPLIYVLHPILRDLFLEDLYNRDLEHFMVLHRRASNLFYHSQKYHLAIFHALEAREYSLTAHFIIETSKFMSMHDYSSSETIAHWIDMLPISILECHPQLLLTRANTYLMQYKTKQALPLLDKAFELITISPIDVESNDVQTMLVEILIARSFALFCRGEYFQSQLVCKQAIVLLSEEKRALRAAAHQYLGMSTLLLGDYTTGIMQLQQALQFWGHGIENRQIAFLYDQLANAYEMQGNSSLSEHHRTRATKTWERLGDVRGKVNNIIDIGATHLQRGAFDDAEFVLKQALVIAQNHSFLREEGYALFNLGEVYQMQSLYSQALVITENGLTLARQLQDNHLTNYALCSLSITYLLMGDPQTALLLLTEVDLKTINSVNDEWSLRELTHGTILLYKKCYDEAYGHLNIIATGVASHIGLKHRQVLAVLRLAACQMAQGQDAPALQSMEKAFSLNRQGEYEYLVRIELNRLPVLAQVVPNMSDQTIEMSLGDNFLLSEQKVSYIVLNPPKLRILALGEPLVLLDDMPITHWRMARAVELYFFLLDSGHPVRKEHIMVTLWPDADNQIDQTLRSTIHYLRKVIGDECVVSDSGSYALNLAALHGENIWYDVAVFQECYKNAKGLLTSNDDDAAKPLFEEMIALYRGDYVKPFYSDWCIPRRDELRRTYMDALTQLAHIAWRGENFDESLLHWQHLLVLDNCLEDAHYGIMCCYTRLGKRTLALRQYQLCEEILRKELSTSPGLSLQKLYRKLK